MSSNHFDLKFINKGYILYRMHSVVQIEKQGIIRFFPFCYNIYDLILCIMHIAGHLYLGQTVAFQDIDIGTKAYKQQRTKNDQQNLTCLSSLFLFSFALCSPVLHLLYLPIHFIFPASSVWQQQAPVPSQEA